MNHSEYHIMDNNKNKRTAEDIRNAWERIRQAHPGIRIRDAASKLDLSEAQLLATQIGSGVQRLRPEWDTFLKRLPELGRVMSLTRNESCVLEHKGKFEKVSVFGKADHRMAVVIGPIETRVFLNSWHVAFAATTHHGDRELISLQVFDHEGHAITKIYLQEDSDKEAYEKLVADLLSEDQSPHQDVEPYERPSFNANPDAAAFLSDWGTLKDTHDFFPMLKKHNIWRYDAVKIAEGKFTEKFSLDFLQPMLEKAAADKLPIMIFAGNRGNLQIHQDIVRTIRMMDRGNTWLNVLDPDFNMHLKMDELMEAWVVTKPTSDGDVTSIECYDKNEELVAQFFGLRKPGQSELAEWKALVQSFLVATV